MKKNICIGILAILCILSVCLLFMSIQIKKSEVYTFIPPAFDEGAKQGVPSSDDTEQYGWAVVSYDELPYKTAVCGKICIIDSKAFVYLTNYKENTVWLKLRMIDDNGDIVAETGLIKPGEYVEAVNFVREMKNNETIKLKIMAYEPETYYSSVPIILNTSVYIGE